MTVTNVPSLRTGLLGRAAHAIVDFVLPETCVICERPPRGLCADCTSLIVQAYRWSDVDGLSLTVSDAPSEQMLRVVRAFKDQSRTALARPLAQALAPAIEAALKRYPDVDAFVVPPSPWASWRKRGFRPVPLVLSRLGVRPMPLLRRGRVRADQRALTVDQRRENLNGAFGARFALQGCTVALVDDVVTTGATLAEAKRAIEAAGGRVACAIALARVPLRHSRIDVATPNQTDG